MDLNNIIGNERAKETLKMALRNKTLSHSYLFEGDDGLGKKKIAYLFAKTLLCKEGGEEPCNKCTSCMKFDGGNHPDLLVVEPEKGTIKKGEIEELIKSVATAPFESKRKVFIIDDSHKMSLEAKNALLKTLEEPPEYINIILISSSINHLLPTILSRMQSIKFYPVNSKEISDLLVNLYGKAREEADFIADFTKGSVGMSIQLATSSDFFQRREEIVGLIDNLLRGDGTKALNSMNFFNDNKEEIDQILDMLLYWFRDLLIYKALGENKLIINMDKIAFLSKQSFMDITRINDIIDKIQQTKDNISRNVNYQLSIESMLLYIQEEF